MKFALPLRWDGVDAEPWKEEGGLLIDYDMLRDLKKQNLFADGVEASLDMNRYAAECAEIGDEIGCCYWASHGMVAGNYWDQL